MHPIEPRVVDGSQIDSIITTMTGVEACSRARLAAAVEATLRCDVTSIWHAINRLEGAGVIVRNDVNHYIRSAHPRPIRPGDKLVHKSDGAVVVVLSVMEQEVQLGDPNLSSTLQVLKARWLGPTMIFDRYARPADPP